MKFNFKSFFVASLAILGFSQAAHAACDQTLNPGSNVVAAVSSAAAGTTVCLNSGNYGAQAFTNIVKSADVVIQSSSGSGATLSIDSWASQHLKFQNLTISGATVRDASTYVSFVGITFTGQAVVSVTGTTNVHILFDTSTFDGITVCTDCYEGRLQIVSGTGVTVTNSHFGGAGESDGIQIGATGAIIGPGNVFEGLVQANYTRHIDSIQGYGQSNTTITGNYFTNDTIYIGFYDGGLNETITNNVFGPSPTNEQKLQLGSVQGLTFTHNTVKGTFVVAQGAKSGSPRNSNATYMNNIFDGTSIADTGDQPGCATNCVYQSNLFTSSANARGTGNLIGKPTYTGGASPTTWAGLALTSTSLGYQAATDAHDMGIGYYGPGTAVVVPAPTSLRVN
jgi:hypothetical protein